MKINTSIIRRGMHSMAAIALSTSLSQAATTAAVSNLGQDLSYQVGVKLNQSFGTSFTVGSAYSSWTLDSVAIRAQVGDAPTADFIVELHADNGGSPGENPLFTFSLNNPSAYADYAFTPSSAFTLNAGTTYWLTAESLSANPYNWSFTSSTAEDAPLTTWSIGDSIVNSTDGGSSWMAATDFALQFSVNATGIPAVPEPSSLALLALGGVAAFRRRRA